jgi:hypothetical protein
MFRSGGRKKQQEIDASLMYQTARVRAPSAQIVKPVPALHIFAPDPANAPLDQSGQYSPPKLGSKTAGLSPAQLQRKLVSY